MLRRNLLSALWRGALASYCLAAGAAPAGAQANWAPWNTGERLLYKLLWPSGLKLGEAMFEASPSGDNVRLEATVEAELPFKRVRYSFSSVAAQKGLCSLQFRQTVAEGDRSWEESVDFDQASHQAQWTRNHQTTTVSIPECARDPLTYLYYFRGELASGRVPAWRTLAPGTHFDMDVEPRGPETATVAGQKRLAEKYLLTFSTRKGDVAIELWVGKDSARQPLLVRMPFPVAVFSAELQ